MSNVYIQGFIDKCGELGVDPKQLIKLSQTQDTMVGGMGKLMNPMGMHVKSPGQIKQNLTNAVNQPIKNIPGMVARVPINGIQNAAQGMSNLYGTNPTQGQTGQVFNTGKPTVGDMQTFKNNMPLRPGR